MRLGILYTYAYTRKWALIKTLYIMMMYDLLMLFNLDKIKTLILRVSFFVINDVNYFSFFGINSTIEASNARAPATIRRTAIAINDPEEKNVNFELAVVVIM